MKNLLLLFVLLLFNSNIEAQTKLPPERIVVIANISNGQAQRASYAVSDLRIESKIKRVFKMDSQQLNLINPRLIDKGGKGWFIQYEFESEGVIGLWEEQLQLRNGQLVITESRNAKVGIAKNCKSIQFTNDTDHCKCAEKKNATLESEVTFRLFSSMH